MIAGRLGKAKGKERYRKHGGGVRCAAVVFSQPWRPAGVSERRAGERFLRYPQRPFQILFKQIPVFVFWLSKVTTPKTITPQVFIQKFNTTKNTNRRNKRKKIWKHSHSRKLGYGLLTPAGHCYQIIAVASRYHKRLGAGAAISANRLIVAMYHTCSPR